jgi:hypothetical protein
LESSLRALGTDYNMRKDFCNVLRLAQERSVPMPVTAVAQQICAIKETKDRDEDFSAVIRTMQDLAGRTLGRSATDQVAKVDKRHRVLRKLSARVTSMRLTDSTSHATA